jgi:hypothetical protein
MVEQWSVGYGLVGFNVTGCVRVGKYIFPASLAATIENVGKIIDQMLRGMFMQVYSPQLEGILCVNAYEPRLPV